MTDLKSQIEDAWGKHAAALQEMQVPVMEILSMRRGFLIGAECGIKLALESEAIKEVVHSLKSEIAEVRRLESKPLFRSVHAVRAYDQLKSEVEKMGAE